MLDSGSGLVLQLGMELLKEWPRALAWLLAMLLGLASGLALAWVLG